MTAGSPDTSGRTLWLCLHFPDLALEIFLRGLLLLQKPVVVTEGGKVYRLNAEAKEAGIQPGNNMDTAYTLSEQVVSFQRNEQKEYAALAYLAQWAYQFTPNVSIKAPDCLLLEISGCIRLFKGRDALKQKIIQGLGDMGYTPFIGVNKTPLAALCHARSSVADNVGGDSTGLDDLPVTHLQVDEDIIDSLRQMGITRIGELLKLPPDGLGRRFGSDFTHYLARLTGKEPDPQKFINPEPHFHSDITFMSDVTDFSALTFPINRLLGELGAFLKARQLCTSHLTWRLSHIKSRRTKSFSIYLANPENDQKIFRTLTQLKLEQIKDVEEVDTIALTVNRFSSTRSHSGDLFHGTRLQQKDSQREHTDQLLNMLYARLGSGTCFGLSLANDHRPEKAWRFVRMGQKDHKSALPNLKEPPIPRPVFLLNTPRPLAVIEGKPCLGGHLELIRGPERIDFGWWDEATMAQPLTRDYYIARKRSGALCWVFNHAGRWYLHGIFS